MDEGLIEITLTVPLNELLMNFTSESEQIMKLAQKLLNFIFLMWNFENKKFNSTNIK